jgi:hypothetical protein
MWPTYFLDKIMAWKPRSGIYMDEAYGLVYPEGRSTCTGLETESEDMPIWTRPMVSCLKVGVNGRGLWPRLS